VNADGDLHPVARVELREDVRDGALTVATLRYRSAAISAFAFPVPTATATSCSRSLSCSRRERAALLRSASDTVDVSAICRMSWDVTLGESIGSPSATRWTASTIIAGTAQTR